ncbi:MAG: TldD/PmbA family protein, partial [Clostridia bacterium]|nr:TldD/PmbA family protein [Clostridia bacterium]
MFSNYLEKKRGQLKLLADLLGERHKYASVLATDVRSARYMSNRMTSAVSDGGDNERGFVVKISDGGAFFEYSFDLLPDDV